jgi:hypothetical protein
MKISKKTKTIIVLGIIFILLIAVSLLIYFSITIKPDIKPNTEPDTEQVIDSNTEPDTEQVIDSNTEPELNIKIQDQPSSTIQIINDTNEQYLHVFLQLNIVQSKNDQWKYVSGKGVINNAVDWGLEGGKFSWNPLGAKLASEAIIPKNEYIILTLPNSPPAFVIMAIKMNTDDNKPLVLNDGKQRCGNTICKVIDQASILIEGGKDMVSDSSAVDGINFKVKYELTTKNGVEISEIHENPCAGLQKKYLLPIGCHNPAKIDCPGKDTCQCCPATQKCMFTDCSKLLFNVPSNSQYINNFDYGNPSKCEESDKKVSYPIHPPVKGFINDAGNLRNNDLKKFCNTMHKNSGNFTTYCYDYNDTTSSPTLTSPYKIKLTFKDLDSPDNISQPVQPELIKNVPTCKSLCDLTNKTNCYCNNNNQCWDPLNKVCSANKQQNCKNEFTWCNGNA